jgi:hypothetical protein
MKRTKVGHAVGRMGTVTHWDPALNLGPRGHKGCTRPPSRASSSGSRHRRAPGIRPSAPTSCAARSTNTVTGRRSVTAPSRPLLIFPVYP